jgi:hypothetical protein
VACFDTYQVTLSTVPQLIVTVSRGHNSISIVTNDPNGCYISNSPTVNSTTGFFVPTNFPIDIDINPNNSQLWVVGVSPTKSVHVMLGA